ncbi:MAG: DUF4396 domain-containing protein [Hyphomicrobiaceae bacterium]
MPAWLHTLAILMLMAGALSALYILLDVARHPQRMAVMTLVWPATGLYAGPLGAWAYSAWGRQTAASDGEGMESPAPPFPVMVGKAACHCGAGCTFGDILAEWLAFFVPAVTVWLGYGTLVADRIFAVWILDYALAFLIGIAFQYATIVPMRDLSPGQGIIAAVKADALSLTAWQVGMYGAMAVMQFWVFGTLLGRRLEVDTVEFWAAMQIAMICGFLTSYPVNWWLIRRGIKEAM